MAEKYFWADQIADEIIKLNPKKKTYVCASGITPSGTVHIGNFREVITTDLVVKALEDRGKKVRFVYSWDDFDRFRKVPVNIPESRKKEYEEYLGMPISDFPSPFDKTRKTSYARYFELEFEESLKKVSIKPEFIQQSIMGKQCKYSEQIKIALENKDKIKKILDKYRKEPLADSWNPLIIYCEKCKKDSTKITSHKGYEVEYECKCGFKDKIDVRKRGIVKLQWRVDWPARWQYEQVDFEPGGIDHSTPGGSFTTSKEIIKQIYDYPVPLYQLYEWIRQKGNTEFSSSAGNVLTLDQVEKVYEPHLLRYLFVGTRPNKGFAISFDNDIIKIYEDFDALERKYFDKKSGINPQEKRMYELSVVKIPKTKPNRESFRHLVTLVQINQTQELNKESKERAEKVKEWLENYAGQDMKFNLKEKLDKKLKLSKEDKDILQELKSVIKKSKTEEELFNGFYELSKKHNIKTQDFFKLVYKILIGKERGPRLAGFILAIGKEKVIKLLAQVG